MVDRHALQEPPPEIVGMVADCLRRRGPSGAARALGVSRSTLLTVAAGLGVSRGSLALLREALARRTQFGDGAPLMLADRGGRVL